MELTLQSTQIISSLLEELETNFPNHIPINTHVSLEEVRRLQGQQEVVQYIRNLVDDGEDEY